ncbi:acyl-CoA thioesterase [Nevskia ramosa]|uniref:acyl-CoA thioesterase n=1 Tax=Nevskia ramosa TaxID=64002 RepID=UPI003D114226
MSQNNRDIRLDDFRHRLPLDVRWGDVDMLGHVNNAKYFTYDESSRIAYFEPFGADDPRMWKDYGLILASIGADFIQQVHYPAQLTVGTRVTKIGRSSMNTLSGLFVGDQLMAAVRGVLVWFDYVNQKAMPVPEHIRAAIRAREAVAPEE